MKKVKAQKKQSPILKQKGGGIGKKKPRLMPRKSIVNGADKKEIRNKSQSGQEISSNNAVQLKTPSKQKLNLKPGAVTSSERKRKRSPQKLNPSISDDSEQEEDEMVEIPLDATHTSSDEDDEVEEETSEVTSPENENEETVQENKTDVPENKQRRRQSKRRHTKEKYNALINTVKEGGQAPQEVLEDIEKKIKELQAQSSLTSSARKRLRDLRRVLRLTDESKYAELTKKKPTKEVTKKVPADQQPKQTQKVEKSNIKQGNKKFKKLDGFKKVNGNKINKNRTNQTKEKKKFKKKVLKNSKSGGAVVSNDD